MADYLDLLGKPFRYGGRGPDTFDCYGLVMELYRRDGIELPDYQSPTSQAEIMALMNLGMTHWRPCAKCPGATVLLRVGRFNSHVGYVLSDLKFVHTWEDSGGVIVERLDVWKTKIIGFYEYVH